MRNAHISLYIIPHFVLKVNPNLLKNDFYGIFVTLRALAHARNAAKKASLDTKKRHIPREMCLFFLKQLLKSGRVLGADAHGAHCVPDVFRGIHRKGNAR